MLYRIVLVNGVRQFKFLLTTPPVQSKTCISNLALYLQFVSECCGFLFDFSKKLVFLESNTAYREKKYTFLSENKPPQSE